MVAGGVRGEREGVGRCQGGKNRKKSAKYRRYIACRRVVTRQMEEISRLGDFSPKIAKKSAIYRRYIGDTG